MRHAKAIYEQVLELMACADLGCARYSGGISCCVEHRLYEALTHIMKTFVSFEIARGGRDGPSVYRSSRHASCFCQPRSEFSALWWGQNELKTYLHAIDKQVRYGVSNYCFEAWQRRRLFFSERIRGLSRNPAASHQVM